MPDLALILPIAHAGHWLVSAAYFAPVLAFVVWLTVVTVRERREGEGDGGSGQRNRR